MVVRGKSLLIEGTGIFQKKTALESNKVTYSRRYKKRKQCLEPVHFFRTVSVTEGRLGIALALPAGQTFSAGDRQLLFVNFTVRSDSTVDSTQVVFIDRPVGREISDAMANVLAANWEPGTIRLFGGYEGDVAPRFEGDGNVTITDWVQCGRFVAGLDTVRVDSNEFQRTDTAPRVDEDANLLLGNGQLSVTDWVQCGRYAARLDSLTPAGGPINPTATSSPVLAEAYSQKVLSGKQRVVRIPGSMVHSGESATLVVELDAEGNENALGFSLDFDPLYLTYDQAMLGDSVASGALLNVNSSKADSGRVGFIMALPTGATFSAGTKKILSIRFVAFNPGATDSTEIAFTGDPIVQEISDASATALPAEYLVGSLTITDIEDLHTSDIYGFNLGANYPNPFTSTTAIEYTLPQAEYVTLKIFNVLGQEIETLVDTNQSPGTYVVRWTGDGYESGVYFYRFRGGTYTATRKLTLLR